MTLSPFYRVGYFIRETRSYCRNPISRVFRRWIALQDSSLGPGTQTLTVWQNRQRPEQPVAWTFFRSDGGRSFYTSLGHKDDFAQPQFVSSFVIGDSFGTCGFIQPQRLNLSKPKRLDYEAGKGKQRK